MDNAAALVLFLFVANLIRRAVSLARKKRAPDSEKRSLGILRGIWGPKNPDWQ